MAKIQVAIQAASRELEATFQYRERRNITAQSVVSAAPSQNNPNKKEGKIVGVQKIVVFFQSGLREIQVIHMHNEFNQAMPLLFHYDADDEGSSSNTSVLVSRQRRHIGCQVGVLLLLRRVALCQKLHPRRGSRTHTRGAGRRLRCR